MLFSIDGRGAMAWKGQIICRGEIMLGNYDDDIKFNVFRLHLSYIRENENS